MNRLGPSSFVFSNALAAVLVTASVARATTCSGTLTGAVPDSVVVPAGATCVIQGAAIAGGIDVGHGGTLVVSGYLEPSTVGGDVEASRCASALLKGNVTVGGSLKISSCTGAGPERLPGPRGDHQRELRVRQQRRPMSGLARRCARRR